MSTTTFEHRAASLHARRQALHDERADAEAALTEAQAARDRAYIDGTPAKVKAATSALTEARERHEAITSAVAAIATEIAAAEERLRAERAHDLVVQAHENVDAAFDVAEQIDAELMPDLRAAVERVRDLMAAAGTAANDLTRHGFSLNTSCVGAQGAIGNWWLGLGSDLGLGLKGPIASHPRLADVVREATGYLPPR